MNNLSEDFVKDIYQEGGLDVDLTQTEINTLKAYFQEDCPPATQEQVNELRFRHNDRHINPSVIRWRDANGRNWKISDMTTTHIINTMKHLERNNKTSLLPYKAMRKELKLRTKATQEKPKFISYLRFSAFNDFKGLI